jgi:hypothetical protein
MIGRERPHMGGLWQIGIEPRAGTAATPVFGRAGTYRMGAVATDEPTVFVSDHRSELDACHAMRAADDQVVSVKVGICAPAREQTGVALRIPYSRRRCVMKPKDRWLSFPKWEDGLRRHFGKVPIGRTRIHQPSLCCWGTTCPKPPIDDLDAGLCGATQC